MATVKQCDRCGKVYHKNKTVRQSRTGEKSTVTGLSVRLENGSFVPAKGFDLCDTCLAELEKWLDMDRGGPVAKFLSKKLITKEGADDGES